VEHIDDLRLSEGERLPSTHRIRPRRLGSSQALFLKGPIPLNWLGRAARLPGKCLHVALALWYRRGVLKTDEARLPMQLLRDCFGVSRYAAHRAIANLAHNGLIMATIKRGRSPICRPLLDGENPSGSNIGLTALGEEPGRWRDNAPLVVKQVVGPGTGGKKTRNRGDSA
jgi:hypothetical protein